MMNFKIMTAAKMDVLGCQVKDIGESGFPAVRKRGQEEERATRIRGRER
jgi:putative aminopeptidase FrvX